MATRILFDPRVDLPDGSTTSSPVIVEATPTGIRANGAVVVLPTTLTFTIATAADILQLATPAASWGWKIVVYRRGTATRYGGTTAEVGSILQTRTVTWTDAPTITWQALTDLDPATLTPTTSAVASWTATATLAQQALDAVNALKAGAPGALDTFLELATQLSADETGAAALAALVAGKAPLASPTFTGTISGITAAMVGADPVGAAAAITLASLGGISPTSVDSKLAALVGSAPAALDTLAEIDAQLATDEGSAAALAALVAQKADAATIASQQLLAWTLTQAFTVTTATRDGNEAITTAAVVWPDGATGTFTTDTASTAFPGAIDAYHVTHTLAGVTKTVTQTAVTRDAGGAVTAQPALTVA